MSILYKGKDGQVASVPGSGGQTTQYDTMPTASADLVGMILQYTGTTTGAYINGYFYKCVANGTNPETYSWINVDVQDALVLVRNEIVISSAANFRQSQGAYSFTTSAAVTITLADANTITIPANTQGIFDVGETDMTLNDYIGLIQYTNNGYEKKIYFTSSVFYLPTTDSVQIDDTAPSSATTYSSSKIETVIGTSKASQMTGATSYQDGKEGLVTKPVAGDNQKALFGDGHYHTIYAANTGSTIVVTTNEPTLYSRPVTLTAGSTTLSGTFSASGECTFSNLAVYGAVSISSSDAQGNIAKGSTNITYFGTYVVGVGFNFATIKFTSSDITLAGTPIAIYHNSLFVAEISLASDGQGGLEAVCYVEELGTYKAMAQTSEGKARASVVVTALHQTYTAELVVANIYGFKIHKTDSNPATCVTAYDAGDYEVLNAEFTSAHMDYTNDHFDYGSWGALSTCDRSEIFFAPKPCMLNYDGTVAYYLDPTDFTKKADGTASDIADDTFGGNAMVEFPTVWFKRWEEGDYAYVLIADRQVDIDFHAYAHHDVNGHILDNIYISMYNGWYDGTRLRSISGKSPTTNTTRQQDIDRSIANNVINETGEGWYILHKAEWDMVNDLLILIGMNLSTQDIYGNGNVSSSIENSGSNDVMFYGTNNSNKSVTVLGIENWWGNTWRACSGLISDNGYYKVKMTYGQEDGSLTTGYNTTGVGYIEVDTTGLSGNGSYISDYQITEKGCIPTNANGSSSTYLCDGIWFSSSGNYYAIIGGNAQTGLLAGAYSIYFILSASTTNNTTAASLSYKGIVSQGGNG